MQHIFDCAEKGFKINNLQSSFQILLHKYNEFSAHQRNLETLMIQGWKYFGF